MSLVTGISIPLIWQGSILLVHSFLCKLTETSMRSITRAEIARFYQYHPHTAARLDYFYKQKAVPLTIIDTVRYSGIFIGLFFMMPHLAEMDTIGRSTVTASFTVVYLFIGNILPQALGARFRVALSFLFAHPLYLLAWLLTPITLFGKLLPHDGSFDPGLIVNDIQQLAKTAAIEKTISTQQAHLITRSVELSGITASDIMIKRTEIKAIPDTATLSEALIEAHQHNHTRFPLTHGNDIDQIIGYVNFKDIVGALRINPADPSLSGIKRPLETVPASMPLPELLQQLTRGYQHMAIVTDHSNRTLGMVTLEDLMEMLVGDLEDEYDKPPAFIIQLAEMRFCAGGGTPFSQLKQKISSQFPDWDLTISEWITGVVKGELPDQFSTSYLNFSFTVRKVVRKKVFDVLITLNDPDPVSS